MTNAFELIETERKEIGRKGRQERGIDTLCRNQEDKHMLKGELTLLVEVTIHLGFVHVRHG